MSERLEHKRLGKPIRLDAKSDAERTFRGHASVFDDPHPTSSWALPSDWLDVFRPGAFKAALAEHKRSGTLPAMFWEHNWDHSIGAYRAVEEDGDGLAVDGQVAKSARQRTGEDIYELLSMGAVTGLSVGFKPMKVKLDEKTKTRELLAVDLFEISPTALPGNSSARITDVKSVAPDQLKRFLEDLLRDAGELSRTEAKALLAEGFPALARLRDAGGDGSEAKRAADLAALVDGLTTRIPTDWRV